MVKLPEKCSKCGGELVNEVNPKMISAITKYDNRFIHGSPTQRVICVECGYIEEYALKPQRFTDLSLQHESANTM